MDTFFDILNIRNEIEDKDKEDKTVPRTHFEVKTMSDFLGYKTISLTREGNLGRAERGKMFLLHQTYTDIVISVHSVIECTKFLLQMQ